MYDLILDKDATFQHIVRKIPYGLTQTKATQLQPKPT